METYEVEIKSLLGSEDKAKALIEKIKARQDSPLEPKRSKQLNHYFTYTDLGGFVDKISSIIPEDKKDLFVKIINEGKDFSIRTRDTNGKVIFVIKASLGADSSSNGVSRMEFEAVVPMTLVELDNKLIDAGLSYQAKWSREREEYKMGDTVICIDKNAGYGYLAEFERVVTDPAKVEETRLDLVELMKEFGVDELKQDRLERMFAFYNSHWPEYYGTDKIFNIE